MVLKNVSPGCGVPASLMLFLLPVFTFIDMTRVTMSKCLNLPVFQLIYRYDTGDHVEVFIFTCFPTNLQV